MKRLATTGALLAALATGGCAQMMVQVDVMDPRYARTMTASGELAQGGHLRAERLIASARSQLLAFRARCYDIRIAENNAISPQSDPIRAGTQTLIDARDNPTAGEVLDRKLLGPLRAELHAADDAALAELVAIPTPSGRDADVVRVPLERAIASWELAYSRATTRITTDLRANVGCPKSQSPLTEAAQDRAAEATQQVVRTLLVRSIVGNGVLLNNMHEAFYVVNAPDRYWAKQYNQAFGRGTFGSTSLAVKLNDTADFSIKGFVFDGRSTADMVKKAGVAAVTAVAAAYGAPTGYTKPQSGAGGGVSFDPGLQVAANRSAVLEADAQAAAYRSSLFQIADAVMSNWDMLVARDADVENVVDAVTNSQTEPYLKSE